MQALQYAKRIGLDKAINDLKEEKKKYLNWWLGNVRKDNDGGRGGSGTRGFGFCHCIIQKTGDLGLRREREELR
jgi:hypothetical protein